MAHSRWLRQAQRSPGRLWAPLAPSQEQLSLLVPGPSRLPESGWDTRLTGTLGPLACGHACGCLPPGLLPHSSEPRLLLGCGLMFCRLPHRASPPQDTSRALVIHRSVVPSSTYFKREGKGKELTLTEHYHGSTPTYPEELSPCSVPCKEE